MEPGLARAKANWLRLFSRVRLQLQEVQLMCICWCIFVYTGGRLCSLCFHACSHDDGEHVFFYVALL